VKLILSTIAALTVTLALFYFMNSLLKTDGQDNNKVELSAVVELYQPPPATPEPPPEPLQELPEDIIEPEMEEVMPITDASPSPKLEQQMPDFDIGNLSVQTGGTAGGWSLPIDAALTEAFNSKDSKGVFEVVPYAARVPNIPEIAWKNKLNGWVLVAFNVGARGHTENIRLLDSNPKGIFEKEAILAVEGWRYDVSKISNYQGDMVLTQKIYLYWKDYPNNEKFR